MKPPAKASLEHLLRRRGTLAHGGGSSLPAETALVSTQRLAVTCLLTAALAAFSGLLSLLAVENIGERAGTSRPGFVIPVGLGLSLFGWWVARNSKLSPMRRLDFGLFFMVAISMLLSLYRHWLPYSEADVVRGITPVVGLIIFFAVFIPTPPRRYTVAVIAASLTDPLALMISMAKGNPTPTPTLVLWLSAPTAVGAILAIVTARLMAVMSREVAAARELGSYRLETLLGKGGMGEVWLAKHRMLARPAAIKLIRPQILDTDLARASQLIERFQREAQATALLNSQHTIELYDFGTAEDGTFYYVMELLEGMDLDELVAKHGAVPPARAARILYQLAHSLRDAHSAGVIHRDIKPANIFLARKGLVHDVVKVLDFGLVKFEDGLRQTDSGNLTAERAIMGTPRFMPPEVACGEPADARSDLYALGCVGYWLLSGRDVFTAPTPMEVMVAHVRDTPPPLVGSAGEALPESLTNLILRCLDKAPSKRPASAQLVMTDLEGSGLLERWNDEDARAWWQQHQGKVVEAEENLAAPRMEAEASNTLLGAATLTSGEFVNDRSGGSEPPLSATKTFESR